MNDSSGKKAFIIFISIAVILTVGFIGLLNFLSSSPKSNSSTTSNTNINTAASVDENGKQSITITAKNGYTPKQSTAQAGKELTLKVDTNNTFDCSSAIYIPKLSIYKQLPASGITEFTIPAQTAGTVLNGYCSMGMYSFQISFS